MAAALWYGVAFAREGGAFLHVVVRENLLRFVDTADAGTGHAHGLGYLPFVGMIGLLPWTLLLPLACAPLADARRRDPRVVLLAAWVVVVLVFFSIAAAKRSVYLLPLFPALAVLLALGVEQPPGGRLARVLRMTTVSYAPALVILGVAAGALASGVDVVAVLRHWLKPRDAQNTIAIVAAARAAAPELLALGLVAIGAAVLIARARRQGDWRRVTLVLVAVTCAWHVVFGGFLHATLGRAASLAPFMTTRRPARAAGRAAPRRLPARRGASLLRATPAAAVEGVGAGTRLPALLGGRATALAGRERPVARAARRERGERAAARNARPPAAARGHAAGGPLGQNG